MPDFPSKHPRRAQLMNVDAHRYVVLEDFWPGIEAFGNITIPRGFVSDLHSIPPLARALMHPADTPEPALIHDYGYRHGFKWTDGWYGIALIEYGVNRLKAGIMTNAVMNFGNPARSPDTPLMTKAEIDRLIEGR